MSPYNGNDEACPSCGLTYGLFRTGMSYQDVWLTMWNAPGTPPEQWKRKSRGVVLGRWHETKKILWEYCHVLRDVCASVIYATCHRTTTRRDREKR